ncbi:hypothetical protein GUITHDRAFT_90722 [Guillardia theta CCMP2712]|uniref:Uncharacterized protein n=1 Tax=Guillardia theta (strain CCMP2712) TaxID=905079 RepID=L1IB98_GUITC|nr:hypothetical protein GUITHDRAFT_90722 [Guillardia theta CCMP2712]EKX33503.1 hypothetical protein GUITHDRAFT_90722 [Guillardia theta CCMP2712]|eukprot:XP_005820483.1 hypothetical protein GUITHDRAFT_90722 [Guillardia theta CCMP2712]
MEGGEEEAREEAREGERRVTDIEPPRGKHGEGDEEDESFGANGFSFRELWRFTGPAWLISIAYLDPGNLETDLQAGAQFGYSLSWVLLWSSVLGLIIQVLSLRLGIVTHRHLAQLCRYEYPPFIRYVLWVLSELMIVASDVPEVIGTAFAIQLLSKGMIPLWGGVLTCAASTLVFLTLSYLGLSYLTAFVGGLVGIMSFCFMAECFLSPPDGWSSVVGAAVPNLPAGSEMIAVGLLGAVAMPHNLFLQSALVLARKTKREKTSIRFACIYTTIETAFALGVSFLVNWSVLLVAASSFAPYWCSPVQEVCEVNTPECKETSNLDKCFPVGLETAGKLLQTTVGEQAGMFWAVALLASGQSSTITGTYAGQFVMEGFVEMSLPLWLRNLISRGIAIVPSLCVSIIAGPRGANDLCVIASIVLALHLPLALIPLLKFTDSRESMGDHRNSRMLSGVSWMLALMVIAANSSLTWNTVIDPMLQQDGYGSWKFVVVVIIAALYVALLAYLMWRPVQKRNGGIHGTPIIVHANGNGGGGGGGLLQPLMLDAA